MKAKLVKESLNEYVDENELYNIHELEEITNMLKDGGFDVEVAFQETHAGIDHYAIVEPTGTFMLSWMPEGYLEEIDDELEGQWGFCLVDNNEGDQECFGPDKNEATERFAEALNVL